MAWMVMAGVERKTRDCNSETCFELNAIDLATRELAEQEAEFRNKTERDYGHTNVLWFPMEQLDIAAMMAKMKMKM